MHDVPSICPVPSSSPSHAANLERANGMVMEGDSSMAAHSLFAKEFLQKIIDVDSCLDMGESLDSLSHIVTGLRQQTAMSEMSYAHARPIQRPSLPRCKMPPLEKAIPLIHMAKSTYTCF